MRRVDKVRVFLLIPFLVGAKRRPVPPPTPQLQPVVQAAQVVDLTHPLTSSVPHFPEGVPFSLTALATMEANAYSANSFTMGEHTGTHVDAPSHFIASGASVESLSPDVLIGPLVVIDIREKVAEDPDAMLGLSDITAWEQAHGIIPAGAIAMVLTGWGERWPDTANYQNKDDAGTMHFPGVGLEASQSLVTRKVACVGIDTLSTDGGSSTGFHQHKHFLASGAYQVENVANLDKVPAAGAVGIVAVLPVVDGSGAPARVLALVPSTSAIDVSE
jgi:kynurenine formamidase